ncbi:MAG: carboxypeptidase regulatory-like domain-containing protein [Verrucomicrobiota bacterium]
MRLLTQIPILILLLQAGTVMAGPQTGAVTGRVPLPTRPSGPIPVEKYTGTISGKVVAPPPQRAGVWIEGPAITAAKSPPRVVLAQQGYQFAQRLLIVPRGTTVEFPNDDNDYHNIFSLSRTKRFDAGRYKKTERPAPAVTFDKVGLVRLQCEIHDHMKAVVVVVDSPWFGVTDAAGKFKLSGIAAGNYTLRAQLDEKTQWSKPITIRPGNSTVVDFSNPAELP